MENTLESKIRWICWLLIAAISFYLGRKWMLTINGMTTVIVTKTMLKYGIILTAVALFSRFLKFYKMSPITKRDIILDCVLILICPIFGFLGAVLT